MLWTQENGRSEILNFKNQDIQNEQSLKWVATYNFSTEKTQLELTTYANWIQNYIYLRPEGIDFNSRTGTLPLFGYTQGNALFKGIDLQAQHAITESLTWQVQASYLRASNVDNDASEFPFIPANRMATGLRYNLPKIGCLKEVFVGATFLHTFQQKNAPRVIEIAELEAMKYENTQPFDEDPRNFDFMAAPDAYSLVNAELGFSKEIGDSSLDFRLGVQNLLNTSYRDYTNRLRDFADDIGRNFTISLEYSF